MSEHWRLFIAIEPPPPVLEAVRGAQNHLKRRVPDGVARWVRPEGVHLTLKFLGDVPLSQLDNLQTALTSATAGLRRFSLAVQGVGCFPNNERPRVVWLGLGGDLDALHALQARVEAAVAPLGYPTEKRPFHPHLTLARAGRRASRGDLAALGELVERTTVEASAGWPVGALSLVRSQLEPGGAIYTQVHQFVLEPLDDEQ
jgi:2'-5' RNA ligase